MEMVMGEDDVMPITIPEAINSLTQIILDVVRKNRTLVDYYIYPKEVPSEIEAYKPRLQMLYSRVESFSALDIPKLTLLVDDAPALVSAFLLPIIDQLLNAVHGIQQIFINHYDRDLEHRKPYAAVYSTLDYRERQLKKFQGDQMRSPQRRLPESLVSVPPSSAEPSFCRFAIAFANHRDHGKLSQVLSEDLTTEDRDRLRSSGGAFLSWDCPGCAFKLKYHIVSSMTSNIQSTDDVRSHTSIPEIEYRPSWLVKCHLHQAKRAERRESVKSDARRGGIPEESRGNTARRQSDVRSVRGPRPFLFGAPRRTKSEVITEKYVPVSRSREASAKYGCPFCFVVGKDYGHLDYHSGKELAEHIAARHHTGRPPSSLMLERFMIAINGQCASNVRRWELNIKPRSRVEF